MMYTIQILLLDKERRKENEDKYNQKIYKKFLNNLTSKSLLTKTAVQWAQGYK